MKTKTKITQSTSQKKFNTQFQSVFLKKSLSKEEIHDELTSCDSQFESTAIDDPFCKYMNPNKLTKKKGISNTSREQSARLQKSNTNSTLKSNPRLLSPKEQVEMIHYLEQTKKTLIEENKRKENLIAKLLIKNKSPTKGFIHLASQHPPKSADLRSPTTRFPFINTPQPNEFQVPLFYKVNQTKVIQNDQNWSFGKLQEEERDNNTKFQFTKLAMCSNSKSSIKNNFSKPLLKLPKEFQLQSWNSVNK